MRPHGSMWGMRATDITLTVLASARLSRLVITDKLGKWWVQEPIDNALDTYLENEMHAARREHREPVEPWWWKYQQGLTCQWCVGFWLGAGVLAAGMIATRRPGPAATAWRLTAGALALNYVTGHAGARLGDFDTEETPE